MRNERGFALIQVVIAAGIFSILSLAMSNLIVEQSRSTAYLEDQLEKIQIIRNFETILKDTIACQQTLQGVKVESSSRNKTNVASLKDNSGNLIYQSNSLAGRLSIGQISITNESVPGPDSSGFVNITMPLSRTRKGGGPSTFKPLEFKVSVVVDSSRTITFCSSAGTQNWVNVTGSRAANTWYTNSTGQTIMVSITSGCGSFFVRQTPSSPRVEIGREVGGGDNLRGAYLIPDTYQYMSNCGAWVWSELR